MNLKKLTSSLLLTCAFNQALYTSAFAVLKDFDEVESFVSTAGAAPQQTTRLFKADAQHTAAGVLFYMRDKHNNYKVILGQRDDDDGFCNFGGKSDPDDGTLHVTAGRESAEESFNMLAIHPYLLSHAPFADLHSAEKSQLYRMYFYETEYVSAERFDKKLTEATDGHSKEYRRFKTFNVEDLLGAVESGKARVKTDDLEEVALYGPLYDMLSTPFYRAALEQLAQGKRPIRLIAPQKASYVREEDYTNHDDGKVSPRDKLAHNPLAIAKRAQKRANINAYEAREELKLIKKLKKLGHNLDGMKIVPNVYEKVQLTAHEEKEFAYTEAFHQRVMMELKSQAEKKRIATLNSPIILEKTEKFSVYSLRAKIDASLGRYTMTEGHLMLVLGKEYTEPTNPQHASQANPHRSANITNLRKYFDTYNSMEYKNKIADGKGEFKRELIVDERYIKRLADVMDSERTEWEKTGFYPIYHGTTDQNGHAFRIASTLHNHLTLSQTDRLTRLRYTDLYFRGLTNMIDDVSRNGDGHYDSGNRDRRIFGNFVLTAGRATSRSTSSSVEYWGNNHSVADPGVKKRFEEGTALLGMDLDYAPYESLFQQFIADTGTPYGNAMLLQLFIKPDALTEYGATDCMDEKVALTAYQNAQAEYERAAQAGKEDFEPKSADGKIDSARTEETRKKTGLYGEVRLSLHPSLADDESQLKMYGLDFFPLTSNKNKRFENELSKTTAANLGHWFSQRTALIPGSLMEAPAARDLYKMVYKGVTGNTLEDVPNTHSLLHLARFGHIEALRTLVQTCPDLVQSIDPVTLCNAALASGSYTVTKYVVEEIIKKPITEILSTTNILTKMQMHSQKDLKSSFNYILKHYDFKDVLDNVKQKIAQIVLSSGNDYGIKLVNRAIWAYTDQDITKVAMLNNCSQEEWQARASAIVKGGFTTIEKFAGLFLEFLKTIPDETWRQINFVRLFKIGLDPASVNPLTGDPLLFELPFLTNPQESDIPYPTDLLTIRNAQGVSFLDHILMEYKKGRKVAWYIPKMIDANIKRSNNPLQSHISPELYNFFKHKLKHNDVSWLTCGENPFTEAGADTWITEIELALQNDSYPRVKQLANDCPSNDLQAYYVASPKSILEQRKLPLVDAKNKETQQAALRDWKNRLEEALATESYSEVVRVLSESPAPDTMFVYNPYCKLADECLDFSSKIEKRRMNRAQEKQKLTDEFNKDPMLFMSHIETIDFSLFDPWFINNFFHDEYVLYTQRILNQMFKDVAVEDRAKAITKRTDSNSSPLMWATRSYPQRHTKTTFEMLQWAGCENVIKCLTDDEIKSLFRAAQENDPMLIDFIVDQAADTLAETKLELCLEMDFFSEKQLGVLVRKNIPALKNFDRLGFPLILSLADKHEKLFAEVIENDPTFLDLTTHMGLTLEEMAQHAEEDDDMAAKFLRRILEIKKKLKEKAPTEGGGSVLA